MNYKPLGLPQRAGTFGNSLSAHMIAAVDSRLGGKSAVSALALFDTITHDDEGPFERNASFWAADLAASLSCASPSNSTGSHLRAVTAITKRHWIGISHGGAAGYPADGATIRFVQADNTVVVRTQLEHYEVPGKDLAVGLLDSDLPAGIVPCKVLPDDILDYLPAHLNIPFMMLDQEEKGLVHDAERIGDGFVQALGIAPASSVRAAFHEVAVAGDSGDPWFVIINGEVVLFGLLSSDTESRAAPGGLNSVINDAIVTVDAQNSESTGYTVTNPTLTGFTAV